MEIFRGGFDLLDQTPTGNMPKCMAVNLVREQLIKKLLLLNCVTQKYGVTFTFKPRFREEDDMELHRIVYDKLIRSNIFKVVNWVLIPEFTKGGALHYHGVISDCYQTDFMRCVKWWRRNYGFVKPELEIRHYTKWVKYICKDVEKTGLYILFHDKKIIQPKS